MISMPNGAAQPLKKTLLGVPNKVCQQPQNQSPELGKPETDPLFGSSKKSKVGLIASLGLLLTTLLTACGSGPLGMRTREDNKQDAATTCAIDYRDTALALHNAGNLVEGMQIPCAINNSPGAGGKGYDTFATIPYPPPPGSSYERALNGTPLQRPGQ